MISKKLKIVVYLLLIVKNSFFANCIDCMNGVKVGETDGWGDPPKGKVISSSCNVEGYSCFHLEIDEIKDPNGDTLKNVVAFSCSANCEAAFENVDQPKLKTRTSLILTAITTSSFGTEMSGVKATCCSSANCNALPEKTTVKPEPSEKPEPDTSAGIKIATSLSLPVVFIVAFFN